MGGRRAGTLGRVVGVALRTSKRACRATGGIDITAGSAPDGKKKQKGPGVNDRLHKPQIRVPRRARTPRCSRLALAARSSLDAGDSANGNALASGGPWRVAVGSLAALWRVAVTSTVLLRQIPALARAQLARKFDTVILTNSITTVRRLRYVYGSWCMQPCIADCCLPPRILLCAHACIVALASIRPYASLCTHPRTSLSHHHSSWPPQLAQQVAGCRVRGGQLPHSAIRGLSAAARVPVWIRKCSRTCCPRNLHLHAKLSPESKTANPYRTPEACWCVLADCSMESS